jgi:hypothetical protein
MASKRQIASVALPGGLLMWLATFTAISGSLSVYFYLRGGVFLASWFGLVMSARHLLLLLFTPVQQE